MDTVFWWENLSETNHVRDVGIDGSIILKWIFKKEVEGMDWIDLAQDRDKWQDLVHVVMNLWVS